MNPNSEKELKVGEAVFWRGLLLNPGNGSPEWSFKVLIGGITFSLRVAQLHEVRKKNPNDPTLYEANYQLESHWKFSNGSFLHETNRFQISGTIDEVLLQVQLRNPEAMARLHDGFFKELLTAGDIYRFLKDYVQNENQSEE